MATWRGEVNKALILSGQATIADNTTFDSDSSLDKIQLQAKYAYNRAYMTAWREGRFRFLERSFTITTADGTSDYNVDTTTAPEYFIENSFRVTTSGSSKGRIPYMSLADYNSAFPEGNGTTEGIPDYWVLLSPDGTGTDKIRFYPTPNAVLSIKYRAYLQPVQLSAASDTIKFPDAASDVLVEFCQVYLESVLGEGKAPDFMSMLQPSLTALKAIYRGPVDEKSKLSMNLQVEGRRIGQRWTTI